MRVKGDIEPTAGPEVNLLALLFLTTGVFLLIVLFFVEITAVMVIDARMENGNRLKYHP